MENRDKVESTKLYKTLKEIAIEQNTKVQTIINKRSSKTRNPNELPVRIVKNGEIIGYAIVSKIKNTIYLQ